MRFKVDEDPPVAVAEALTDAGAEVATVADQGWSGWSDLRIWDAVRSEGRILVTADKGLADVRLLRRARSRAGVVLLRAERESWRSYQSLARKLAASVDLGTLAGAVAVVTQKGVRVRRGG